MSCADDDKAKTVVSELTFIERTQYMTDYLLNYLFTTVGIPVGETNLGLIFNPANWTLIHKIDIPKDCKCANLSNNLDKQSHRLFRIISKGHKLITKL